MLETGYALKKISKELLSGILWGPVTSPINSTSTLLSCQACREGEVIIQLSLNPTFDDISDSWEQVIIDPHQPLVIKLTDLTPGKEYFVRCCLKDVDTSPPFSNPTSNQQETVKVGSVKRTKKANQQKQGPEISSPTPRSISSARALATSARGQDQNSGICPKPEVRRFNGVEGGCFNESRFMTLPSPNHDSSESLLSQSWSSTNARGSERGPLEPSAVCCVLLAVTASSAARNWFLSKSMVEKMHFRSPMKQVSPIFTGCFVGDPLHHLPTVSESGNGIKDYPTQGISSSSNSKFYGDQAFALHRSFPLFNSQESIFRSASFVCALHDRFTCSDEMVGTIANTLLDHPCRSFCAFGPQMLLLVAINFAVASRRALVQAARAGLT
jgi:hypothetical protein